jgi:hypothetical protein
MTEKASDQTGWVVRVDTFPLGGGPVSETFWLAAVTDKAAAVEAVKRKCSTTPDQAVEAVKELPANEIKGQKSATRKHCAAAANPIAVSTAETWTTATPSGPQAFSCKAPKRVAAMRVNLVGYAFSIRLL